MGLIYFYKLKQRGMHAQRVERYSKQRGLLIKINNLWREQST